MSAHPLFKLRHKALQVALLAFVLFVIVALVGWLAGDFLLAFFALALGVGIPILIVSGFVEPLWHLIDASRRAGRFPKSALPLLVEAVRHSPWRPAAPPPRNFLA